MAKPIFNNNLYKERRGTGSLYQVGNGNRVEPALSTENTHIKPWRQEMTFIRGHTLLTVAMILCVCAGLIGMGTATASVDKHVPDTGISGQ